MTSSEWLNAVGPPNRQLLGQSPAFKRLRKEVDVVCASDLTVLITGETGVARAILTLTGMDLGLTQASALPVPETRDHDGDCP